MGGHFRAPGRQVPLERAKMRESGLKLANLASKGTFHEAFEGHR